MLVYGDVHTRTEKQDDYLTVSFWQLSDFLAVP